MQTLVGSASSPMPKRNRRTDSRADDPPLLMPPPLPAGAAFLPPESVASTPTRYAPVHLALALLHAPNVHAGDEVRSIVALCMLSRHLVARYCPPIFNPDYRGKVFAGPRLFSLWRLYLRFSSSCFTLSSWACRYLASGSLHLQLKDFSTCDPLPSRYVSSCHVIIHLPSRGARCGIQRLNTHGF